MTPVQGRGSSGPRRWLATAGDSLRLPSGTPVGRFAVLAFLTLAVIGVLLGWLYDDRISSSCPTRSCESIFAIPRCLGSVLHCLQHGTFPVFS